MFDAVCHAPNRVIDATSNSSMANCLFVQATSMNSYRHGPMNDMISCNVHRPRQLWIVHDKSKSFIPQKRCPKSHVGRIERKTDRTEAIEHSHSMGLQLPRNALQESDYGAHNEPPVCSPRQ